MVDETNVKSNDASINENGSAGSTGRSKTKKEPAYYYTYNERINRVVLGHNYDPKHSVKPNGWKKGPTTSHDFDHMRQMLGYGVVMPRRVAYYREKRPATTAEITASIEKGRKWPRRIAPKPKQKKEWSDIHKLWDRLPYGCIEKHCKRRFKTLSDLDMHCRDAHGITSKQMYRKHLVHKKKEVSA